MLFAATLGAGGAHAAIGAFDPTFGSEGLSINQFSSAPEPSSLGADVAVAPDGKIVVAGQINDAAGRAALGVARYLPNGQLDSSFGSGGAVELQLGEGPTPSSNALYSGLAVMPDGRIVVAGVATDKANEQQTMVARLTASGALDPTFNGGFVLNQLGEGSEPSSEFFGLALQPDNKIVLEGVRTNAAGKREALVERVNTNGEPDGTFGTGGVFSQQLGVGSGTSVPSSAATDAIETSDGGFVVSAQASETEKPAVYDFALFKLNSTGKLDLGFGSAGGVTLYQPSTHPGEAAPFRVVRQPSGKLVLGGAASFDEEHHYAFAVARFTENGIPDPSFGAGGSTLTQLSSAPTPLSEGVGLVEQANGDLVLPGIVAVDASSDYILTVVRYTAEGALDPTFASNGVLQRQLGTGKTPTSAVLGAAIDHSGQLLVTGEAGTSSGSFKWLVGRVILEETPLSPPAPPPPGVPCGCVGSSPSPFAGVSLLSPKVTLDSHGNVTLKLSSAVAASGSVTLTGTVPVKARGRKHPKPKTVRLGSASFTLVGGKAGTVKVHLSSSAVALLRKAGHLQATATISAAAAGRSKTTTASVTIFAPKPKRRPKHHH